MVSKRVQASTYILINNKSDFDIVIIGGGPAGSAAALFLLKYSKLKVAVVESTSYKELRVGETVSPSLLPILRYLDVEEDFLKDKHLPSYGINSVWGTSQLISRNFLFTGQGNGWHLDRKKFDSMLARKVMEKGGSLFTLTRLTTFEKNNKKWHITLENKDRKKLKKYTRFVIDASGKNAVFARKMGTRWKIHDHLIGVVSFFRLPSKKIVEKAMTLESAPHGWWYSSPLPQNKIIVAFMTDSDIGKKLAVNKIQNWSSLLDKTIHVKKLLSGTEMITSLQVHSAYSQVFENVLENAWAPAGEAAVSFDPLASRGIGYAMTSGIEAARVAYASLNHGHSDLLSVYLTKLCEDYERYLGLRRRYYAYEHRWQDNIFWKRRMRTH